jgi:small subunit ribosomal protein S20
LANIKSQIKRNRQNEKRRLRNRNFRGAARTAIKGAHVSLVEGTDSKESVMLAISALDRAAQKGAIHSRNAARRKGRLMKQLNKVAAAPSGEPKAGTKASLKKTAAKKSSK